MWARGGRRKIINFQELTTLGWYITSLNANIASRTYFLLEKIWRHFEIQYVFVSRSQRKTNLCPVSFPPPFLHVETPLHPLGSFVSPLSQECLNHKSLDWPFSCPALSISESRVEAGPCTGTALGVWILLHVNKLWALVLTEVGGQSQWTLGAWLSYLIIWGLFFRYILFWPETLKMFGYSFLRGRGDGKLALLHYVT